jgi:hypothetical protein
VDANPDHRPVWQDPLLGSPPRPSGTGTGAYVEQREPDPAQYTIEGEIAMIGKFARGAARAPGWQGRTGRILVGVFVGLMMGGAVAQAVLTLRH